MVTSIAWLLNLSNAFVITYFQTVRAVIFYPEVKGLRAEGSGHPQDRQRDMSELTQVLRGKTDSWSIEKRCIRKDGSVVRVSVNGAVLRDDAGRAVRIMAMIGDLTASQQAEQESREAKPSPKKNKPMQHKKVAVKKATVKKARKSESTNSSDKPRLKKR
jgi:hypothetical protein